MSRTQFSNVNKQTINDIRGQGKYNYTMIKYGAIFYSRHTGTKNAFLSVRLSVHNSLFICSRNLVYLFAKIKACACEHKSFIWLKVNPTLKGQVWACVLCPLQIFKILRTILTKLCLNFHFTWTMCLKH